MRLKSCRNTAAVVCQFPDYRVSGSAPKLSTADVDPQVAAGSIASRIPSARKTLVKVASSGFPSADRDRSSASRVMPVLRASSDIPHARATSPSAAASTRGSSSAAAAAR